VVTLAGAPPGAEGAHVLTAVTQRLGSDLGYVTEFSTASPRRAPDPPRARDVGRKT
jgi:hypothetical protein